MGLGDWNFHYYGNANAAIDLVSPLEGNGTLKCQMTATGSTVGVSFELKSPPFSVGFAKGRIRSLIQRNTANQNGSDRISNCGFYAICDAVSPLLDASGRKYYWAGINRRNTGLDHHSLDIVKVLDGSNAWPTFNPSGGNGSVLSSTSIGEFTNSQILPLEFEWQVDITNVNGVRLILRAGTVGDTGFTTLSTIADIIDSVSPLTSALSEGCVWTDSTITNNVVGNGFRFDKTSVYKLR